MTSAGASSSSESFSQSSESSRCYFESSKSCFLSSDRFLPSTLACPEYECIYRKGWGPPGAETMDKTGWKKYLDEMDRDAYEKMYEDLVSYRNEMSADDVLDMLDRALPDRNNKYNTLTEQQLRERPFCPPGVVNMDRKVWRKYLKQIEKSQGFDIVDFPGSCEMTTIIPLFKDMSHAKDDPDLIDCSIEALNKYNPHNGTHYTLEKVLKANYQMTQGITYWITFEAKDPDKGLKVFQAKVYDPVDDEEPKEVERVRLRPKRSKPKASKPAGQAPSE